MKTTITENLRAHHTPAAPPTPPCFQPEPPHAIKVKRAAVIGGCVETARHQIIEDTRNKLAEIERIVPEWAQAIKSTAAEVELLSASYFEETAVRFHTLSDYKSAVRGRAITIEGIHAKENVLESAKATLDSPESLKLSGEELMVLTQQVKHLPTIIKDEWNEIPTHETRIRELQATTGIPVARIIEDLIAQLPGLDGRCSDLALQRAIKFLPLDPKLFPGAA